MLLNHVIHLSLHLDSIYYYYRLELIFFQLKLEIYIKMNYNEMNQCAYSLARSQINNRKLKSSNSTSLIKPSNSNLIKSITFFEWRLAQFQDDIKDARAETIQISAFAGMLQQQSNIKARDLESRLFSNINTFYQYVFLKQIQTTKNRTQGITHQSQQLQSKYQDIEYHIHELTKRLCILEQYLGYYNGKEHLQNLL